MKNTINRLYRSLTVATLTGIVLLTSCKDLTELNVNPNGIDPDAVHPNLLITTVITQTATREVNLGFGDIAGVMQHTQKDAWFEDHNNYEWSNQSWSGYYNILEDARLMEKRASDLNLPFYVGVGKVISAYNFGRIADLWGDAPFTDALQGDLGGEQYLLPKFDTQQAVYEGVISLLEEANQLFSEIEETAVPQDVLYEGNLLQWRKFANSLRLRYYLRISEKAPDMASSGIQEMVNNPSQYPLILDGGDNAYMSYPGTSANTSWPSNTTFDGSNGSNYRRIKMCATLVDKLQELGDSRLDVWAKKIEIPIEINSDLAPGTDEVIDGVRYIAPDVAEGKPVDTDPEYVGLPPSVSNLPSEYNLNPTPGQQSYNPHVSFLSDMYTEPSGELLKARLVSAAEVQFDLAEAAQKGWISGDVASFYNEGVRQSLMDWSQEGGYDAYIAGEAAFDGTLEQILEQKWIASWAAATEAWFDYRRTGLPDLQAGPAAVRSVLPLRFYYMQEELSINEANANEALERLESTPYSQEEGKNSAWSKFWLVQGTGKPW
ncbi:SusD/RagB family nutrient-binding outer membrane lipoprotein [Echinicola strongylocentroti]|uniref:SusD/RagB family nutrient-binding outer membrane lipoprotein n=1 Tax=Echinicola strongylocentroti TaxID=1795355 RepID=A0A2Z4IR17_9BACT|nr:SusD/RagB family nutrient-binding outer membrane lipoprotein [Echinicola strongylocentroti]AWW33006.1 SusD/RagB family nutrient-binding outer membrane lipoprotein [Echinicola strongylocentroti]